MSKKSLFQKIENLPLPIIPTLVGATTLSNMYFLLLGSTWIRHLTMWFATIMLLAYLYKIIFYFEIVKKEYLTPVPSSLMPTITMLMMILSSYYFNLNPRLFKYIWLLAIAINACHILVFLFMHLIKNFSKDTFVPSWFVTLNGIMVSVVVGGAMKEVAITKFITYYGILSLTIALPIMIFRLVKSPVKDGMYHTKAILLAPSSLCVVSCINVFPTPNIILMCILYSIVFLTLIYVIYKIPKFFCFPFSPSFAALTFPMAIGIVASVKMSEFLALQGLEVFSTIIKEIAFIQLYLTTVIIAFVLFNFFRILKKSYTI
jgi:exfoliative toxin A/B